MHLAKAVIECGHCTDSHTVCCRLFGDEMDVTFWTVAVHYLRAEKACPHTKVSDQ